jgi:hypothetical protein
VGRTKSSSISKLVEFWIAEAQDDNAAATEEVEEEVDEEVGDAAKGGEVKTNYPR